MFSCSAEQQPIVRNIHAADIIDVNTHFLLFHLKQYQMWRQAQITKPRVEQHSGLLLQV